jgi:hypothetical protein
MYVLNYNRVHTYTIKKSKHHIYSNVFREIDDHKIGTMSIPSTFTLEQHTIFFLVNFSLKNDNNYSRFVYLMKMRYFSNKDIVQCHSFVYIYMYDRDLFSFVLVAACFSLHFLFFFLYRSFDVVTSMSFDERKEKHNKNTTTSILSLTE